MRAHIAPPPNSVHIWMVTLEGNLVLIKIHLHRPPQDVEEVQVGAMESEELLYTIVVTSFTFTKDRGPKVDGGKDVCSDWCKWDGRHNSKQPSFARFVYGTTLWKMVLARCMNVVHNQ